MRIIHLERRNDMGNGFYFFETTYFICPSSFVQRYESVADLRSKKQNAICGRQAGMRSLSQLIRLLSAVKYAL